jgi:hypothetical protein
MNPTPESTRRDLFAEIDEIAWTTQAAVKQIAESFEIQKELNVSFNNTMVECLKVISAMDERIYRLEGRVSALETAIA